MSGNCWVFTGSKIKPRSADAVSITSWAAVTVTSTLVWPIVNWSGRFTLSATRSTTVAKSTVPHFTLNGFTEIFARSNVQSWNTYNQYNLAPSLSMTKGTHTIRAGLEVNYVARGDADLGWANGDFNFGQGWTRQFSSWGGGTYDGSTIASILLGYPNSGQVVWNDTYFRTRPYYAGYVQDDWKVTRKLTLNLGLRYDVQLPFLDRYNRLNRGFDMTTKNPLSDAVLANWAAIKVEEDAKNPKS